MGQNNDILEARGVSLTQKQWARCDRITEDKGYKSRNAFIRKAVDFYCAWIEKEHIEKFLLPSLESVIGAKVRDSEERICRLLFKLAVEQNSLAKIMAREYEEYDKSFLEEIRQESIREVKETNGTIRIREHFE